MFKFKITIFYIRYANQIYADTKLITFHLMVHTLSLYYVFHILCQGRSRYFHDGTHVSTKDFFVPTLAVFFMYLSKWILAISWTYGEGGRCGLSTNDSPQVLVKKSVSLLDFLGSFNTAGRLTVDEYTVQGFRTTDGADLDGEPSILSMLWMLVFFIRLR